MRLSRASTKTYGIASLNTVAAAVTAANSIVSVLIFSALTRISIIDQRLEIEIDHFFHDQYAHCHPDCRAGQHDVARRVGEKQRDVMWGGDIDQDHHGNRQGADDGGGGFWLLRHGLDFGPHFLSIAQYLGKVAERFGKIAAGLLLD